MIEKLKEIFKRKDKKIENLIFLLAILIITLICINYIMKIDEEPKERYADAVLANAETTESTLETRIESILSKISGVRQGFYTTYICR